MLQKRDPGPTEQLCLLSADELLRVRRLLPRSQKGKGMPRMALRRNVEECAARSTGYVQDSLPGL
jgi:hypothetical protein